MTPTKLLIGQMLTVFAIVLAGIWFATQWAAAQLAYQIELGAPSLRLLGFPIYRPWALFPRYDSVVAFGQKRALVVWQRIILPDGSSVSLDNMSAADPSGYAGLEDRVDFHTWQLLRGVAISTLLGVGSDLQFSGNGGLIEAIRQSATQNVSRTGDQLTARALDVQPTITIRPGAPVRLLVDRDLILAPWRG